ncbi:G-patch domain-containing protein [Abeliophyllum distichum]|uniref:G-patch domain-containing protein n=1 Tax=Abeliophyllum distichum TaxID=126358 RepID=A0ABD1QWG6_9LAMI
MAEVGEEEEDYMGDLSQFVSPETSNSSSKKVSSSTASVSNSSNKKSRSQNRHEQKKLKRERDQIEEDQQTLERLGSAIPQSNIGFKLLKQMGYTPGSALGKQGSGRAEPVGLDIRRGRAGIGKEDPKVEKLRIEKENAEMKRRKEEELMAEFGSRQKELWKGRRITVNFRKAEAVLAQLENRDVVEVEKKDENDGEKEEEEEEEEITEEDLLDILMKLRNEFHYCLFCGCQYESAEALLSNCPGINEDDH